MRTRIREAIGAWARSRSQRGAAPDRRGGESSGGKRARIPSWLPVLICAGTLGVMLTTRLSRGAGPGEPAQDPFDLQIQKNANKMISDGRQIFRFDTFGDEAFWGGVLKLHEFVQGV